MGFNMRTFYQFIESQNVQISLDLSSYEKSIWKLHADLLDYTERRYEELSRYKFDRAKFAENIKAIGIPKPDQFLKAVDAFLSGRNINLYGLIHAIINYQLPKSTLQNYSQDRDLRERQREAYRALMDLRDSKEQGNRWGEKEHKESYEKLVQSAQIAMQKMLSKVRDAANRVDGWKGSTIIVEAPTMTKDSDWLSPIGDTTAHIHLNHAENTTGYDVEFLYDEVDGKVEIDDDLDAGDTDFFTCAKLQEDYFNLIGELKKPGSTSKGKDVWIYTARPFTERKFYQQAEETKQIPANLFATSTEKSAIELIPDLAGSDKRRDVWKIKINSKYLIEKEDFKNYKYYQTKGTTTVPIINIMMVWSSE